MLASGSADGRLALWATLKRTTPCEVTELGSEVRVAAWRNDDGALLVDTAAGDISLLRLG
jgi:WD40 repeat protein